MNSKKWHIIASLITVLLLSAACASASRPRLEKPQFTHRYYTHTILYAPEQPSTSHKLEVALALLLVHYPEKYTEFLYEILYKEHSPNLYRDRLIREQRDNYRRKMALKENSKVSYESPNWRYAETINIENLLPSSITLKREDEIYEGGAHSFKKTQYIVLDMDDFKQIKVDDLFEDFQGDKLRFIVYEQLRSYGKLASGQPLSEGIFFTDEPELTFNFYVTEEGLGLHWDAYQIAPHSEGSITIVLPWWKIQSLLRPSGIDLLEKFNIHFLDE